MLLACLPCSVLCYFIVSVHGPEFNRSECMYLILAVKFREIRIE